MFRRFKLAALFVVTNVVAPASAPLTVLRVFPTDNADPAGEIRVTFDRPIATGLDGLVPAERIFRIDPAVEGKVEWRDPITLRFQPARPLESGASYRITISNDFTASDGSRLDAPYTFTFRVAFASVLLVEPGGIRDTARYLPARPTFRFLLSAPVDGPRFVARTDIRFRAPCSATRIPMNFVGMRPVNEQDSPNLRYQGLRYYGARDTLRDLRRVLELTPQTPLPLNCKGELSFPVAFSSEAVRVSRPMETYGPLRLLSARCAFDNTCPVGPVRLRFSTPVKGAELLRRVRIAPAMAYTVRDTLHESAEWVLDVRLKPRQSYAVTVDSTLTDVFGQRLGRLSVMPFTTTSYAPTVSYQFGKLLVEREGLRTLPVQVVNVDTLLVTTIPVPQSAEAEFLSQTWRWSEPFQELLARAQRRKVAVAGKLDAPYMTGVSFPVADARAGGSTLFATRITRSGHRETENNPTPIALLQVTDLAVHGRIGIDEGMVWVTGVRDGRPRANALITLYDRNGRVRTTARTDAQGLARLRDYRPASAAGDECCGGFEGYLAAVLNDDRAVVGINTWDPDLAAWRFDISGAWSDDMRIPAAAAVFTERGIYRPGERVYAKAIVRQGPLGSLMVPRGDSIKWVFRDRDNGVLRDTVTRLSNFGTADQSVTLASDMPLGDYNVQVSIRRDGAWQQLANTNYQVAEYRPPEFLVDVHADDTPRFGGDSVAASVTARYLFGAPMARAQVRWIVQQRQISPWELEIPNTEGFQLGSYNYDEWYSQPGVQVVREGVDTLDARGNLDLKIALPVPASGQGARAGILAVVSDANRQTVSAGKSIVVHPAAFYIGARSAGNDYFWRAGNPVTLEVIAARPNGERVTGASVEAAVVRREWHSVRRTRNGQLESVGSWVSDTVSTCRMQTAAQPVTCRFTPAEGGSYMVEFTARDEQGRQARTTLWRWAAGPGFVPWRDETQLRIDIIPDRQRYSVGDTATLLIASPFTDVEAWLTIERERVLESRRMRLTAGATTVKVPITEALAPNAFVSVLLVRGRSAPPGPLDDPGRPALRVGYTELRVLPAVKQLNVQVTPLQPEYRPGDTARVRVEVRDAQSRGQSAEVTLWAVDEGVLALTGYQTPDPVSLIYQARPLGVRLASNLVALAPQIPPGAKGQRAPGGGGGGDVAGILRSRFQTTAFFIGSLVTDANGVAVGSAKLPDNLTTFRIMAVAVTAGDRYGSGKSSMLVTRPLVARPALPRFVREGDRFQAGVLVNQRKGGTQRVDVEATATGIALNGSKKKNDTLSGAAAREVRFDFSARAGDSASFQFTARAGSDIDAVRVRVPVKPNYYPLAQTIAGALRDTAQVEFVFDQELDAARSRLEISFGTSTLSVISGAHRNLRVYPYYCTEQVSSVTLPLIALYRAQSELGQSAGAGPRAADDINLAIRMILRRQSPDGGIGYWAPSDWSTPWLTSYATRVLLEARAAGFAVDSTALSRIGDYLARALHERVRPRFAVARWHDNNNIVLSERVAAVDVLSRLGRADVAVENTLFSQAAQLRWEDRVLLAEVMARRGATNQARSLLNAAWQGVRVEGRTLSLPSTAGQDFYFRSDARPAARLLGATLAVEPNHPQLGLLVETLVQQGRALSRQLWNTQDYGATVLALLPYEQRRQQSAQPVVQIRGARGNLLTRDLRASAARDTSVNLNGLIKGQRLRLNLSAQSASTPVYYYLTVREVPRKPPVKPVDNGISLERWYERVDNRSPITTIAAGELVRVRIRITVPEERHFVIVDDPLPGGLEAVDLSLRTVSPPGAVAPVPEARDEQADDPYWYFGSWDSGVWSAFDHKELRDDRVVYSATLLWKGTYTATYLARATTPGRFMLPPAHAEEMYNPAVNGRTGGGVFVVTDGTR